MITELFLGLTLLTNLTLNWLFFLSLSDRKKEDLKRDIGKFLPNEGKVVEWQPPRNATKETAAKLLRELQNGQVK